MKKILWVGCAFLALVLLQLVCLVVFLFLAMDPLVKALVLAAFLVLIGGCVFLAERLLAGPGCAGELTDRLLALIYVVRKMVSGILTAGVLNLLGTVLSGFFTVGPPVLGVLALVYGAVCVVSGVALFRALGPEGEKAPEQEEAPDNPGPEEKAGGGQEP